MIEKVCRNCDHSRFEWDWLGNIKSKICNKGNHISGITHDINKDGCEKFHNERVRKLQVNMVKELREKTGQGMSFCHRMLTLNNWDYDKTLKDVYAAKTPQTIWKENIEDRLDRIEYLVKELVEEIRNG